MAGGFESLFGDCNWVYFIHIGCCPSECCLAKALSEGIHPSINYDGSPLPAAHMKWAGKSISGKDAKIY